MRNRLLAASSSSPSSCSRIVPNRSRLSIESSSGLNFCSKAAQNVHIVTAQGLDGMKVDLQDTTGIEPYPFASEWEAYCPKSAGKLHEGAVVYQVIV